MKQTTPPTSYSSSEDEEWEDAVDGEDEEAEEKRTKKDRKGSAQSQHSHLVTNSFSLLSETGKNHNLIYTFLSRD